MGIVSDTVGKAISAVASPVLDIIDQTVEDKDQRNKLKQRIQSEVIEQQNKSLQARVSVILAEANGSWLQRNWRPLLMLIIMIIIANNYVLAPYIDAMFGSAVTLDLPERLWDIMALGVGGYVTGRSVEKTATNWQNGKAAKESARSGIYQNVKSDKD
ncbi:holin (3TMs family) [Kushneria sinocarnis]|uniref:Holin (3TMs family) n=2 Tax=Kushneria sinocarnis TaxID=595502 RepID=A0A420WUL5_9GAMM|nr:holin (3TMs family) [Kushneria sinocarnis]